MDPNPQFFEGHSGVVLRGFLYFIRATFYAFIYLFKHKETNRICVGIQFTDTHTRE